MDCKSSLGRLCFLHTALQTNEVLESAYGEFQNSSCGAETPWMPIMQWRESLEYSSLNLFIFDCFILLWVEGKDGTDPRRLPGGRGVKPRRVISQLERHIQGPTSVHICGPFKVISSLCVFTLRGRRKKSPVKPWSVAVTPPCGPADIWVFGSVFLFSVPVSSGFSMVEDHDITHPIQWCHSPPLTDVFFLIYILIINH